MVVILKLGELGRDAVLNIRDALIQPGDNPLQRLCVLHAGKEGNDLVERFDGTRCVTRNERVDLLLQGCQRVPDFRVVVAFPVLSFGYHPRIFFAYFPMLGFRIDRRNRGIVSPKVRGVELTFSRRDRQDIGRGIIRFNRDLHLLHDGRQLGKRMNAISQLHVEFTVFQTFK